jgi:hypothetical protein
VQNIAKITAGVTNADQRPENATTRSACVTLAPLNWAAGTDRAAPVNRLNRWVLVHSSIRICVALSMNIDDLQRPAQVPDRAAPVNRRNRLNRWVLVHSSIRICVALSMNIADDALHLFGTTNTAL